MANLSSFRKPYHCHRNKFDIKDLKSEDPIQQFTHWFEEVSQMEGVYEPNVMSLATATKKGIPSVRMVLLKSFGPEGFTFFTNYDSRKGKELAENPVCSLMFYWEPIKRSVRIEGTVVKLSNEESTKYFHSRPRESQIGACVSHQSQVITNRGVLDKRKEELAKEYAEENQAIPKPDYWGGFLVRPQVMEFWQGQSNRLHDRIVFRKLRGEEIINRETTHQGEDGWVYERLSP